MGRNGLRDRGRPDRLPLDPLCRLVLGPAAAIRVLSAAGRDGVCVAAGPAACAWPADGAGARMTRVAVPALVVRVVVATLVGVAGWNRSGPPRAVVTLTERELPMPWETSAADEDPGRQLLIEINRRDEPLDALNWLPQSRLRAIGFPFSVAAG